MFSRQLSKVINRAASNVAVLGAAGGIGQPLSLLLKENPAISKLNLYDIVGTPGVAADLSHCDTIAQVEGFQGAENLKSALTGMDLVIIPAGVPRKPGMTRDDLFNTNAGIVATLAEGCAKYCPDAWVGIISNPVNSTVPIAVEIYKNIGSDSSKIFGVTTLDIVRSQAFVAEKNGSDVTKQSVPVIGGHAGTTIIPVLSKANPKTGLNEEQTKAITARIQDAGTEVVKAKAGTGSATLSMAFAGARFVDNCLKAQSGKQVTEYAYIPSKVTDAKYFSTMLTLGKSGIEKNHGLGDLNDFEQELVANAAKELTGSITKGEKFAESWCNDKKSAKE